MWTKDREKQKHQVKRATRFLYNLFRFAEEKASRGCRVPHSCLGLHVTGLHQWRRSILLCWLRVGAV